jgi:hypothetical protein
MSSHHFVKEGQEPALLITGIRSFQGIEGLLEWAPLVMVMEPALDKVLTLGIKIDVVVAAAEHVLNAEHRTSDQMPVSIISYQQGQNSLQEAIRFLLDSHRAAYVVTDQIDDNLFKQLEKYYEQIAIVLTDGVMRWIPVSSRFEKWMPASSRILLRNVHANKIIHTGLIEISQDVYQSVSDGKITLSSKNLFWIGEEIH